MILNFKQKEWKTSINDLIIAHAKKSNIKFYFNKFFKLVLLVDSKVYTIDTYKLNKNILTVNLKEI